MKKNTINEKNEPVEEPIVIADECGDSMWDALLGQEVKACEIIKVDSKLKTLPNSIENVQACENTEAR
jgi:hypothetical protein